MNVMMIQPLRRVMMHQIYSRLTGQACCLLKSIFVSCWEGLKAEIMAHTLSGGKAGRIWSNGRRFVCLCKWSHSHCINAVN